MTCQICSFFFSTPRSKVLKLELFKGDNLLTVNQSQWIALLVWEVWEKQSLKKRETERRMLIHKHNTHTHRGDNQYDTVISEQGTWHDRLSMITYILCVSASCFSWSSSSALAMGIKIGQRRCKCDTVYCFILLKCTVCHWMTGYHKKVIRDLLQF